MDQDRNFRGEAASQVAWARPILALLSLGAYTGEAAAQMEANAELLRSSASYKSALAQRGCGRTVGGT
jgi:hypothetical protein